MLGDGRDVGNNLAQARQGKFEGRQAIEEILAESLGRHILPQIAVGGGDHAHVGAIRIGVADAPAFVALQQAQKLGLHLQRQIAHFIQQKRSAGGRENQPAMIAISAGEGAFAVAEQLALGQLARQGSAVDRHERRLATGALIVDQPSCHLFSRAGFAANQHRGVAGSDFGDQPLHFGQRRAAADQLQATPLPLNLLAQCAVLIAQGLLLSEMQKMLLELGDAAGLGEIVVCAVTQRGDGGIEVGVGCENDHRDLIRARGDFGQQFQAASIGQIQIEQDDVERSSPQALPRLIQRMGKRGIDKPL